MIDDLISRLRATRSFRLREGGPTHTAPVNPNGPEAAEALIKYRDALEDVGEAIRELRLADAHAARTGSEGRWDRALSNVCQYENRIKCTLSPTKIKKAEVK